MLIGLPLQPSLSPYHWLSDSTRTTKRIVSFSITPGGEGGILYCILISEETKYTRGSKRVQQQFYYRNIAGEIGYKKK